MSSYSLVEDEMSKAGQDATTMDVAKAAVEAAGFTFDRLRSYVENDGRGYAFSVESDRSCYGAALYAVAIRPAVTAASSHA